MFLISTGRLFHSFWAADWKARSPGVGRHRALASRVAFLDLSLYLDWGATAIRSTSKAICKGILLSFSGRTLVCRGSKSRRERGPCYQRICGLFLFGPNLDLFWAKFPLYLCNAEVPSHQTLQSSWFFSH